MFCFLIKKRLIPYIEGALNPQADLAVDKHISRCPRCAAELDLIRGMCSTLRSDKTPVVEPAADLWQRIEQEIAASPQPNRQRTSFRGLRHAGAVAAVAVAAIAVVNLPTKPVKHSIVAVVRKQNQTIVARLDVTPDMSYDKTDKSLVIAAIPKEPVIYQPAVPTPEPPIDMPKPSTAKTEATMSTGDTMVVDKSITNYGKSGVYLSKFKSTSGTLRPMRGHVTFTYKDIAPREGKSIMAWSSKDRGVTDYASGASTATDAYEMASVPRKLSGAYSTFTNYLGTEGALSASLPAASVDSLALRTCDVTSPPVSADDNTSVDIMNDADDGTRLVSLFSYP